MDFTVSTDTSMLVEEGETFDMFVIILILFIICSPSTPDDECGDSRGWSDSGLGEAVDCCEQNLGTWAGISSCKCVNYFDNC